LPLVKWLLAIRHYVVLFFLDIAAFVVVIVVWFAILFNGTSPGACSTSSRGHPLEHPGDRLCVHPRHRPVPAVPAGPVGDQSHETGSIVVWRHVCLDPGRSRRKA
jgi:hypothetical protein